jgi:FKBP-type peptidyl-prolyl cis-trans isomerase
VSTLTKSRALLVLSLAALAAGIAGCGGAKESVADKFAAQAVKEAKNPPKIAPTPQTPPPKVQTVTPGPGEGDLKTKPKIPAQTGAAPKQLVVQDLVPGTGQAAKDGDQLSVQYVGVLYKTGKQFDASWDRGKQPFQFTLGQGGVIKGWDQGLVGMKVGGRRRLIIPASLAYGAAGQPPTIPANSALVFDIDLTKIG